MVGSVWLEQLGGVESVVFYIFCAVAALNIVLALAVVFLGCLFPASSPGYSMDFYIAVGCLAMVANVLLQGLNPNWGEETAYESLCQVAPAVLVFGWLWVVGGLLMKPCAITHYHRYTEGAKVRGQEWKPNLWLMILILFGAVAILIWVIQFPMRLIQTKSVANLTFEELALGIDYGGNEYECIGAYHIEWKLGMLAFHGVLLLLAAIMVWVAIAVSKKRPSRADATLVCIIIYNLVLVVIATALVTHFLRPAVTVTYAIMGGLSMYVVFVTMLCLLISKILGARRIRGDGEGNYAEVDDKGVASSYQSSGRFENVTPEPRVAEVFTY